MKKRRNIFVLVTCLIAVYLVAFIGSIFTSPNTQSSWYLNNKPPITPPNYLFPIVWNVLFFLIALSLYHAWISSKTNQQKIKIIIIFGVNLVLNALWSYLFFTLKNPLLAFADIVAIWITIILMIVAVYNINKVSSYELIPYFLWVSFAGILNYLWI